MRNRDHTDGFEMGASGRSTDPARRFGNGSRHGHGVRAPSDTGFWSHARVHLLDGWGVARSWGHRLAVRRHVRSLVGDILLVHLVFATFVGFLAVGGLWLTSRWVIEDNLNKWAAQWVMKLDDLGAPLYVAPDREEFQRVENYVSKFPEIAFVRYYKADGELLFAEYTEAAKSYGDTPLLGMAEFEQLLATTGSDEPYMIDDSIQWGRIFHVSTCMWSQSIVSDGLIGFDPDDDSDEQKELLGYVELGLDFGRYHDRLNRNVLAGSAIIAVVLFLLGLVGRHTFKRALRPLSELREPLDRLARGDMDVPVDVSAHSEIMAINNALVSTINALQERDEKLRKLANFDPLTGLMSRHCFNEELEMEFLRVRAERTSSALLFVDLDQFKYVNDTVGHAAGDRLLVRAAKCIQSAVNPEDVVSRFGGDEFTILVRDIKREEAEHFAAALVKAMADAHFVENGHVFNVYCSIGVALIDSGRYGPEEIVAQADMACHEAKSRGRNRHQVYEVSSEDKERMASDMGWSQRIKLALNNDEFILLYQPIVDLGDGSAALYEVLLRMRGEGRRTVLPGAFLPAANRFGMMVDVDYWVIEHALAALGEFRREGQDVVLALNLSGVAFDDDKLIEFVREHLARNELHASSLVIEVTEQVAVRYVVEANRIISQLRNMGVGFALDDFGAGFSSFNYLKQLPMDYLKIDGTFVENLANDSTDQAMVKSIVQIAKSVGMRTIAEHVSDREGVQLLRDLGVDYAQGYYLARPQKKLAPGPFSSLVRGGTGTQPIRL